MRPQYVAARSSCAWHFDAVESQARALISASYLFHRFSRSFPQGYPQVTCPQNARRVRPVVGLNRVEKRDRRLTCLRASRAYLRCPCLPSWQHVARTIQMTLRNLWSLTPFQSPLSRFSPTSITEQTAGQAFAPVPYSAAPAGGCA